MKLVDLDLVHFIPTNISNSHKNIIASGVKRIEMLQIALSNPKYHVDNREILRGGVSYMIHTLESISDQFPDDYLYLIIGLDLLADIVQWKRFSQIMNICNIIVSYRKIDDMMNAMNEAIIKEVFSSDTVEEIFENLEEGYSQSGFICEGCGLILIANLEGEMKVMRIKDDDEEHSEYENY